MNIQDFLGNPLAKNCQKNTTKFNFYLFISSLSGF